MDAQFHDDVSRLYRVYRAKHAQLENDVEAARKRIPTIWPKDVPIPFLNAAEFERRVQTLSSESPGDADVALWLRDLIRGVEEEFPSLFSLLQNEFRSQDSAA